MKPVRIIVIIIAICTFALGAAFLGGRNTAPNYSGGILGSPAPKFEVTTAQGEVINQDDLIGKVTFINFWNSWCIPCKEEIPHLDQFKTQHGDDPDLNFIAIVRADDPDSIEKFLQTHEFNWTVAFDSQAAASKAFGVIGQPSTYVIAPDGTVVAQQLSKTKPEDLENMLAAGKGHRG